jgi:hypothetical protein
LAINNLGSNSYNITDGSLKSYLLTVINRFVLFQLLVKEVLSYNIVPVSDFLYLILDLDLNVFRLKGEERFCKDARKLAKNNKDRNKQLQTIYFVFNLL